MTLYITKSKNPSRRGERHCPISSAFTQNSTGRFHKEAALGPGVISSGNAFLFPCPDTRKEKKKKKHTKNKNTTAKQQLAFILCSELWKYFHTQLEGCKEKLLNGLMPCWQTRPLSRVHRNGGHRWQHRDSQRHSMREWTLRSAVMPAPALITLHTAHSPHGNAGRKAEWSVSGVSKLQPGAKCGPWLVTVNKSVLEHSHTHSFTVYGCFPATTTALSRSWNRGVVPTMLKLLFGPLQNVFVNPNLRDTYEEGSRPLSYWLAGPRRKHVSTLL